MFTIKVQNLEDAKRLATWGTYGKGGWDHCKGNCPLHQYQEVRLQDCSTERLQTLWTNDWLTADYDRIVESILDDRGADYELPVQPETADYFREFRHFNGELQYRVVKRRKS